MPCPLAGAPPLPSLLIASRCEQCARHSQHGRQSQPRWERHRRGPENHCPNRCKIAAQFAAPARRRHKKPLYHWVCSGPPAKIRCRSRCYQRIATLARAVRPAIRSQPREGRRAGGFDRLSRNAGITAIAGVAADDPAAECRCAALLCSAPKKRELMVRRYSADACDDRLTVCRSVA